jgi:curli biogenesis system outer membrane secretion channel CsgG
VTSLCSHHDSPAIFVYRFISACENNCALECGRRIHGVYIFSFACLNKPTNKCVNFGIWVQIMLRIGLFILVFMNLGFFGFSPIILAKEEVPMGSAYKGPKCVIAVGDFTVQVRGAPQEIGDGLREMLQTALFESNHFFVVDRSNTAGISAEQLLSESFMSNPDAILQQGQMYPAEVLVYGAVTTLEGGGLGLRLKVPGAPVKLGGAYHKAKVTIDIRLMDSSSGRVIASQSICGTALSGSCMVGTVASKTGLPMALEMVKNTPLELAIRDCIYRAVISLCKTIPRQLFKHRLYEPGKERE